MHVIEARNVHQALPAGLGLLLDKGEWRGSRNGEVRVMDGPVTTVYIKPTERVIFHSGRDANPFFHFYESLWMLAGRNDVAGVAQYAGSMKQFSDDQKVFHGAYGYRWRQFFGFDQLEVIAKALKANPEDRRCVLQMWSATADLGNSGKDFPCNTQVYFSISQFGTLDMTVCNRSNDVIWGAYGANAVHFSALQEFMAAWIGVPVGMYWQMSNNYHAYRGVLEKTISGEINEDDPYALGEVQPYPMVNTDIETWQRDLSMLLSGEDTVFQDPFFRRVAKPILAAHAVFKDRDKYGDDRFEMGRAVLESCAASDWQRACSEYIDRRERKHREAQNGTSPV